MWRTVLEGLALFAVNIVVGLAVVALNLTALRPSDANLEGLSFVSQVSPALLVLVAVVLAPVLEELVFRGVPLALFRRVRAGLGARAGAVGWALGGTFAALFAVAHAFGGASFAFPLPQFLLGLWSWRVALERGLPHSMLLHAVYNFVPAAILAATVR